MEIAVFLPDGVPLWVALLTVLTAFMTAALTAAFGIGGGLMLLAVMSAILPAPAVVPVHGVAQLGSNVGRFILHARSAVWPVIIWFVAGGLIGTIMGGRLALELPVWGLRLGVSMFILYMVWGPKPKALTLGTAAFFITGAVGSFLTMFFGATGPLAATMLSTTKLERIPIVATHAACMTAQHGLKILVFGVLGFAYGPWVPIIIAILIFGFAGTYLGSGLLRTMPEQRFRTGMRYVLTVIAIYLFAAATWEAAGHMTTPPAV